MEKIVSEFEKILPEDVKQFKELFKRYKHKKIEDLDELYYISTNALILAQRWCEIQSTATVIAKENNLILVFSFCFAFCKNGANLVKIQRAKIIIFTKKRSKNSQKTGKKTRSKRKMPKNGN